MFGSDESRLELPTMLHLCARYGLSELAACLIDLPGAHQAYSVTNARGLYPESIAAEHGHTALATMFANYRELVSSANWAVPLKVN